MNAFRECQEAVSGATNKTSTLDPVVCVQFTNAWRRIRFAAFSVLSLLWTWPCPNQGDERIWIDAQINGQPARLVFDTGAETCVLFPKAAKRLGLRVTEPPADVTPPPGKVAAGFTGKCRLSIPQISVKTMLAVLDLPRVLKNDIDGLIGWGLVCRSIIEIDEMLRLARLERPLNSP